MVGPNQKQLVKLLREVRSRANFETAGFSDIKIGNRFEMHFPQDGSTHEITEAIKETTRLYRESWINPILDDLILWAEGKKSLSEIARYHR